MKQFFIIRRYIPLIAIYLSIVGLIIFRIIVHPNYYTTPDSIAYLNQAEFIKTNWLSPKGTFTTWPIGYPAFIALISKISTLSVLVSSKVVNLCFLGGIFVILSKWFREKSWFVALIFCSYGALEILSQTWTETSFIFFLLFIVHTIKNENKYSKLKFISFLTTGITLLFLCKYTALFIIIGLVIYLAKSIYNHNKGLALSYIISLFIGSIFIISYLYSNYLIDGFLTGESRIENHLDQYATAWIVFKGLLNEVFIARKHYENGFPDLLFYLSIILQGIVGGIIFYNRKYIEKKSLLSNENTPLFIIGFIYLTLLITARFFIPLYDFDFRLLSPFTIPKLIGIIGIYIQQVKLYNKTAIYIIGLHTFSFILGLPKIYLLDIIKTI